VGAAGVHADLRQTADAAADLLGEDAVEPIHVGPQLLDRAVLLADLADLAADRDGHTLGLELADQGGQLGAALVVVPLLLVQGWEAEVDQGRGVDVDVAVPGRDGLTHELPKALGLLLWVGGVLLGVGLVVVALDEDRALVALAQGGSGDDRGVLVALLVGVAHLGTGQLEDERADVLLEDGADDGPGGVVDHAANVDGRDSSALVLTARASLVEVVDRSRLNAELPGRLPDQPAGSCLDLVVAEHGGVGQTVHELLAKPLRLRDPDAAIVQLEAAPRVGQQVRN
jgi:hypothetical protein